MNKIILQTPKEMTAKFFKVFFSLTIILLFHSCVAQNVKYDSERLAYDLIIAHYNIDVEDSKNTNGFLYVKTFSTNSPATGHIKKTDRLFGIQGGKCRTLSC